MNSYFADVIATYSSFVMMVGVGQSNLSYFSMRQFGMHPLRNEFSLADGYFLARWLNRVSYRSGLGKLKQMIDELEKPE